jgi:diguanylate cyclase (GGDEF)-like protein/PAS domain S-box-containing protein
MRPSELAGLVRSLVDSTPDAVVVVDDRHRVVFVNDAAERVFAFTRDELLGSAFERLIPERFRTRQSELVTELLKEPKARSVRAGTDLSGVDKNGREFPVEITLQRVQTNGVVLVAAVVRDVSMLRQAQEVSGWLEAIVQSTGDAVVGLDPDGKIATWNPAAERLHGYTPTEVFGRPAEILTPREHRREQAEVHARALAGEIVAQVETQGLRKDGSTFPIAVTVSPIRDVNGTVIGVARIVRDVSDRTRFEQELKFFADHDPLTGLFNRRRFSEELARHVAFAERYPQDGGALLMGDLDNFKYVNDTLGHKSGDELIKGVAHLLRGRLRDTDVLGRLGGDEFAMLLPRANLEQAAAVAEELCEAVRGFEMVIEGHRLHATVSVGIAPINAELTAEDSLAAADVAMYDAKRGGRDRVVTAAAEHGQGAIKHHLGWAERLRAALERERFELFAQPIVELATGKVAGRELLLRMREHGELIPPNAFIYTAERFGLIEEIDRYVIAKAIRLLADEPNGQIRYHVNVSGISLVKPDLVQFLAAELAPSAVDPALLTLEVTETAAIIDMDAAARFARALQSLGCGLALDDFGSGFGSFSYLKYVPVQFIKIDGSFVSDLADNPKDRLLVKAIIQVARGMKIKTIGEHVSSEKARQLLTEYGADYGQGYHLGEPQPIHVTPSTARHGKGHRDMPPADAV